MTSGIMKKNLFFLFDSTCTLAMLNPVLDLKNMLINNAIQSFKEGVSRISVQFPNANIMVGHLSGAENPADRMTKLFKDPIAIINSKLYREGPSKFGSLEAHREDVAATCANGEFTFHGLPYKFVAEDSKSESESCKLVRGNPPVLWLSDDKE